MNVINIFLFIRKDVITLLQCNVAISEIYLGLIISIGVMVAK